MMQEKMGAQGMKDQRILLVDDDPGVRKAASWALEDEGYEVTPVANGGLAVDALRHRDFGLVITDLMMPVKDGFAVLRRAKELNPATRVIIVTGNQDRNSKELARRLNADDYILKPFDLKDLKRRVAHCLKGLLDS